MLVCVCEHDRFEMKYKIMKDPFITIETKIPTNVFYLLPYYGRFQF